MRFLVDAHIGKLIIAFLESRGHEVLHATSFPHATGDLDILRAAARERRVIMTSDTDFGELVYRLGEPAFGVVLLRIDVATEAERLAVIERFWASIEPAIPGHFVTVTAKRVRRSPLGPMP